MLDYDILADKAKTLIDTYGRSIVFLRFRTTPANASKPWQGPTNPRSPALESKNLKGVFLDPLAYSKFGVSSKDVDLIKRSDKIVLVSTGAADQTDLSTFNEVVDGTENYRITGTEALEPGNKKLLYFVGISR